MTAVTVGLAMVTALLGLLVVGLLRSHAEILRALHDQGVHVNPDAPTAPAGSTTAPSRTAPGVALPRAGDTSTPTAQDLVGTLPDGGAAKVATVGVAHDTLIAFLSTTCGTCLEFWQDLAGPLALPGRDTRVVIVTQDPEHEQPSVVADLAPATVTTLMSSAAWDDHDVPVSPYFLLVDGPTGRIVGEGSGTSWTQVADLLGRSVADGAALDARVSRREMLHGGGRARAARVDEILADAGIGPGHPSLHPPPLDAEQGS